MSAKKRKSVVSTIAKSNKTDTFPANTISVSLRTKIQFFRVQMATIFRYALAPVKRICSSIFIQVRRAPARVKGAPKNVAAWHANDKKKKKYRSFRLQKKIRAESRYVPSAKELFSQSFLLIIKNWPLFVGIMLVHGALYALLVKTTATLDISSLQNSVKEVFGSEVGTASGTASLVGAVLGSPRKVESGGFVVTFLVITTSLIYVWAARERINGAVIRVRDALFNGLGPLAGVFTILLFMGIQLVPFGIATFFYTSARSNALFASGFEDLFFFMITFFSGLVSFYFLTSSIIALYAAALPGVYPLRALKAAKELVAFRRLSIFRRVLSLAVLISLTYLVLLVIVVRLFPDRTYTFIDTYQIAIIPFINVYLYKLYRALL